MASFIMVVNSASIESPRSSYSAVTRCTDVRDLVNSSSSLTVPRANRSILGASRWCIFQSIE